MNIVKQITDHRFAIANSHKAFTSANWTWGLNEGGELCFKGAYSGFSFNKGWYKVKDFGIKGLTLEKMSFLVRAFEA